MCNVQSCNRSMFDTVIWRCLVAIDNSTTITAEVAQRWENASQLIIDLNTTTTSLAEMVKNIQDSVDVAKSELPQLSGKLASNSLGSLLEQAVLATSATSEEEAAAMESFLN
mmetsp:Transcript_7346/g.19067  ORF Transcript_7346/g.19067 Transcript_7346/m.19067 type:complete len:112 (-) Transcript_7346:913-1248(-)